MRPEPAADWTDGKTGDWGIPGNSPEQRNGAEPLSFRSPSQILAMPRNPKANFLGDHLLGIGSSLVLAGIGGIGKSRILLQLLVSFILERICCGFETHHTKAQPWMLVQTQNGISRLQDDLEPLKKFASDDWQLVNDNLHIHTLETDRDPILHLSDPDNARALENEIRQRNPIGVAFDPLADIAIGDLSKDVDMNATCRAIGQISRAGNPDRAIVILTHALTGLAGMKKAFGFEAAGFGRNSKVLQTWSRAFINIIPGTEDYSVLVLTCGKNNDGKMFAPCAVRLNPDTRIYEPDDDFDIEGLREQIATGKKVGGAKPEDLRSILKQGRQYELKQIVELIKEELMLEKSQAYTLARKAKAKRVLKYNRQIKTYELV